MRVLLHPAQALAKVPAYVWAGLLLVMLLVFLAVVTRASGVTGAYAVTQAGIVTPGQPADLSRPVDLPHVWDNGRRGWNGQALYRLRMPEALEVQASAGTDLGLLLPRVGVRFRVLFNGRELVAEAWRSGPGYFDSGTHAHFVSLPAGLMMADWSANRIDIEVRGQALRISGLAPVWIGPRDALQQRHRWLSWWQVDLTWMVAATAFMMGLLSLLIWTRTAERLFGLLAAGLLVLTLRLFLSTPVFLPGPFLLWDYLHKLSFTLYCGFTYLFMAELFDFRQDVVRRIVNGMMWLAPLWLAILAWSQNYQLYRVWTGVIVLVCVLALVKVMHRARWGMDVNQRLMVVVGMATLVTGLRDFLVVQLGLPGDVDVRWMTPGSMVLMFAMGWVLARRTTQAFEQVGRLNSDLACLVDQREKELHEVFDRLRAVESQRVLEAERRRLTRDMHDGLGSQLVQTLNLVRSSGSQVESAAVLPMLSHALEELRMTLDSLEPMEGDLATILGTLRQRIAPALQAARIELDWQVQDVPALTGLEARGVMHLFRCLQEVFANVVKHAHATCVTVRTWTDGASICLSVTDDGVGLGGSPDGALRSGGRGISNIRLRAAEIGADVRFSDACPGTCVSLTFVPAGVAGHAAPPPD